MLFKNILRSTRYSPLHISLSYCNRFWYVPCLPLSQITVSQKEGQNLSLHNTFCLRKVPRVTHFLHTCCTQVVPSFIFKKHIPDPLTQVFGFFLHSAQIKEPICLLQWIKVIICITIIHFTFNVAWRHECLHTTSMLGKKNHSLQTNMYLSTLAWFLNCLASLLHQHWKAPV